MKETPRNHKLFYGSSYDRGLDILLSLWPKIKEKYPDATLDICYGWELFDKGYADNPERQAWKEKVSAQMKQPGITHHGRVGKEELKQIREKCGIWAYPTYFSEIFCITALDAQNDGLVPCTSDYGALAETVQSGFKVHAEDGDAIYDYEVKKQWLDNLFKLMDDEKLWEQESKKAREFAKDFSWDRISNQWIKEMQ